MTNIIDGGGNQPSLASKMKALADACRARFNVTGQLSLDEMIKLVSPPKGVTMIAPGNIVLTKGDNIFMETDRGGTAAFGWCNIAQSEYNDKEKVVAMNRNGGVNLVYHLFWQGIGSSKITIGQDKEDRKQILDLTYGSELVYVLPFRKGTLTMFTEILIAFIITDGGFLDQARSYVQAVPI